MSGIAIVVGASSAIGRCVMQQLLRRQMVTKVIAVSRSVDTVLQGEFAGAFENIVTDYSDASIRKVCSELAGVKGLVSCLVICNGILHNGNIAPEKRLEDISSDAMLEVMRVNAVLPVMWLAGLAPLLKGTQDCGIAVFGARVGSIADNQNGGWYAYRASKAALNMLLKSAAIELARRAPNVRVLIFHPGTTDTALSRPFQRNVPAGKLFTPEFVADRLLTLMTAGRGADTVAFVDWDGKPIPW